MHLGQGRGVGTRHTNIQHIALALFEKKQNNAKSVMKTKDAIVLSLSLLGKATWWDEEVTTKVAVTVQLHFLEFVLSPSHALTL